MREPYFRTVVEYTLDPGDGVIGMDDKILLQSNGDYVRVSFSDPCLSCQRRVIEIPIERLFEGF